MNILRISEDLATEYIEQLIEAFELELVTSGAIDPNDEYAGHYHGLEIHRDTFVDGIKSEDYSRIYVELNDFLRRKDISLDQDTAEYEAVARRFLLAKIEAIKLMMDICQGKSYNYTVKSPTSNVKPPARKKRPQTLLIEGYIDDTLPGVLEYSKSLTKMQIAEDIAYNLKEDLKITREPSAILSEYLQNHPLMK